MDKDNNETIFLKSHTKFFTLSFSLMINNKNHQLMIKNDIKVDRNFKKES